MVLDRNMSFPSTKENPWRGCQYGCQSSSTGSILVIPFETIQKYTSLIIFTNHKFFVNIWRNCVILVVNEQGSAYK